MVDQRPVGHLGLAQLSEANDNTDYSDSEAEEEVISDGVPMEASSVPVAEKRSSARIQLTNQAGAFHKRARHT